MIRTTAQLCPHCKGSLLISCDMWGEFYACEACGFTAEDDDEIKVSGNGYSSQLLEEVKNRSFLTNLERREIA